MKKITSVCLLMLVCLMAFSSVSGVFASDRFNGLTVLYTVTTQAEVDLLPSDIDASGFQIAVLVDGDGLVLNGLTIHDATDFGIAVDSRSNVDVTDCTIYNIGDHDGSTYDPTGRQAGLAVYYYASSGEISGNTVSNYQKGGIIANLPCSDEEPVCVLDNTVTGLGPVDFIAQNGIQIGWEQKAVVRGNRVSGNYYIDVVVPGEGKAIGQQAWVSCGILLYGVNPPDVKRGANILRDNQVQFYIYPV